MNMQQIVTMLENKLITLNAAKDAAFNAGQLEDFSVYETQILETEETLNRIKSVL